MLYEYAALRGNHKSLARYRNTISSPKAHDIYQKYLDQVNSNYNKLEQSDRDSIWREPTEKAKLLKIRDRELMNTMYAEIATLCEDYKTNV